MTKYLNSTAAILVFSVMANSAQAQDAPVCDLAAPEFPCTLDGTTFEAQEDLAEALANGSIEGVGSTDTPLTEDVIEEAPLVEEAPAVEEAPVVEEAPAVEEAPVVEEEPADEAPVEDAEEEVPAEEAPAEEAVEAAPAEDVTDGAPEEEVVEEAPEEEPAVEADTTPAEEAPAAVEEDPAEDSMEDQSADETVEEATTEESSDATPAEDAADDAPAEENVEDAADEAVPDEGSTDEMTEEETTEETAADETPSEEMTEEEETADVETTDPEALADDTPIAPEDTVEEVAPSAAASEDSEAGEVEEETVTDEDVRSSDQDFDNSVTAAPAASDDDEGLSNFERALIVGLGAVAIGSILDNGDEVVSNSGDRIVLQQPDGTFRVLKDDDVLLRQPGSNVRVERFDDGSSRTFVTQADGNEVVTIRSAEGRVLRRALILPDGSQVELFDDTQTEQSVDVTQLPAASPTRQDTSMTASEEELRAALQAEVDANVDRTFSLRQVRNIREVRELAPLVELDTVTFETGSAAIQPDQARDLARLGTAIKDIVDERPGAVFLIEGHTDAVGSASYNLALSDRRAETVALALTEYFDVPAANLVTQGYGETALKVRTLDAEVANRRASVRNITQLLR